MSKKYSIKKAKGTFIYDIHGGRFYDLQKNSNILGHSYKKLTTIVKNNISSKWNISDGTFYHIRMKKLFEKLFSSNYFLRTSSSLIEFILRLNNYCVDNLYNINFFGERFNLWIKEKNNIFNIERKKTQKDIIIYDMAEIFLRAKGDIQKFNDFIKKLKKEEITVFNYFWYPYLDLNINNADIIILPEIYSGNFCYLNVLINKKISKYNQFSNELESIPSLYISSSLKMFYLIKRIEKEKEIKLKWNNFIQAGRLFSYNDIYNNDKIVDKYFKNNIILSKKPPFYNYLPLNLEDYQIKYLNKVVV